MQFGIETRSSPFLYVYQLHGLIVMQVQHIDYLIKMFETTICEHLHNLNSTYVYLLSMLRIIFFQSSGLLVASPSTLLLRPLLFYDKAMSTISVFIFANFICNCYNLAPYLSICSSRARMSIGLTIFSTSLASNNESMVLITS